MGTRVTRSPWFPTSRADGPARSQAEAPAPLTIPAAKERLRLAEAALKDARARLREIEPAWDQARAAFYAAEKAVRLARTDITRASLLVKPKPVFRTHADPSESRGDA